MQWHCRPDCMKGDQIALRCVCNSQAIRDAALTRANWILNVAWVGLLRLPMTVFFYEAIRSSTASCAAQTSKFKLDSHLKMRMTGNYREFEKYCRTADEVWTSRHSNLNSRVNRLCPYLPSTNIKTTFRTNCPPSDRTQTEDRKISKAACNHKNWTQESPCRARH